MARQVFHVCCLNFRPKPTGFREHAKKLAVTHRGADRATMATLRDNTSLQGWNKREKAKGGGIGYKFATSDLQI